MVRAVKRTQLPQGQAETYSINLDVLLQDVPAPQRARYKAMLSNSNQRRESTGQTNSVSDIDRINDFFESWHGFKDGKYAYRRDCPAYEVREEIRRTARTELRAAIKSDACLLTAEVDTLEQHRDDDERFRKKFVHRLGCDDASYWDFITADSVLSLSEKSLAEKKKSLVGYQETLATCDSDIALTQLAKQVPFDLSGDSFTKGKGELESHLKSLIKSLTLELERCNKAKTAHQKAVEAADEQEQSIAGVEFSYYTKSYKLSNVVSDYLDEPACASLKPDRKKLAELKQARRHLQFGFYTTKELLLRCEVYKEALLVLARIDHEFAVKQDSLWNTFLMRLPVTMGGRNKQIVDRIATELFGKKVDAVQRDIAATLLGMLESVQTRMESASKAKRLFADDAVLAEHESLKSAGCIDTRYDGRARSRAMRPAAATETVVIEQTDREVESFAGYRNLLRELGETTLDCNFNETIRGLGCRLDEFDLFVMPSKWNQFSGSIAYRYLEEKIALIHVYKHLEQKLSEDTVPVGAEIFTDLAPDGTFHSLRDFARELDAAKVELRALEGRIKNSWRPMRQSNQLLRLIQAKIQSISQKATRKKTQRKDAAAKIIRQLSIERIQTTLMDLDLNPNADCEEYYKDLRFIRYKKGQLEGQYGQRLGDDPEVKAALCWNVFGKLQNAAWLNARAKVAEQLHASQEKAGFRALAAVANGQWPPSNGTTCDLRSLSNLITKLTVFSPAGEDKRQAGINCLLRYARAIPTLEKRNGIERMLLNIQASQLAVRLGTHCEAGDFSKAISMLQETGSLVLRQMCVRQLVIQFGKQLLQAHVQRPQAQLEFFQNIVAAFADQNTREVALQQWTQFGAPQSSLERVGFIIRSYSKIGANLVSVPGSVVAMTPSGRLWFAGKGKKLRANYFDRDKNATAFNIDDAKRVIASLNETLVAKKPGEPILGESGIVVKLSQFLNAITQEQSRLADHKATFKKAWGRRKTRRFLRSWQGELDEIAQGLEAKVITVAFTAMTALEAKVVSADSVNDAAHMAEIARLEALVEAIDVLPASPLTASLAELQKRCAQVRWVADNGMAGLHAKLDKYLAAVLREENVSDNFVAIEALLSLVSPWSGDDAQQIKVRYLAFIGQYRTANDANLTRAKALFFSLNTRHSDRELEIVLDLESRAGATQTAASAEQFKKIAENLVYYQNIYSTYKNYNPELAERAKQLYGETIDCMVDTLCSEHKEFVDTEERVAPKVKRKAALVAKAINTNRWLNTGCLKPEFQRLLDATAFYTGCLENKAWMNNLAKSWDNTRLTECKLLPVTLVAKGFSPAARAPLERFIENLAMETIPDLDRAIGVAPNFGSPQRSNKKIRKVTPLQLFRLAFAQVLHRTVVSYRQVLSDPAGATLGDNERVRDFTQFSFFVNSMFNPSSSLERARESIQGNHFLSPEYDFFWQALRETRDPKQTNSRFNMLDELLSEQQVLPVAKEPVASKVGEAGNASFWQSDLYREFVTLVEKLGDPNRIGLEDQRLNVITKLETFCKRSDVLAKPLMRARLNDYFKQAAATLNALMAHESPADFRRAVSGQPWLLLFYCRALRLQQALIPREATDVFLERLVATYHETVLNCIIDSQRSDESAFLKAAATILERCDTKLSAKISPVKEKLRSYWGAREQVVKAKLLTDARGLCAKSMFEVAEPLVIRPGSPLMAR